MPRSPPPPSRHFQHSLFRGFWRALSTHSVVSSGYEATLSATLSAHDVARSRGRRGRESPGLNTPLSPQASWALPADPGPCLLWPNLPQPPAAGFTLPSPTPRRFRDTKRRLAALALEQGGGLCSRGGPPRTTLWHATGPAWQPTEGPRRWSPHTACPGPPTQGPGEALWLPWYSHVGQRCGHGEALRPNATPPSPPPAQEL